MSRIEDLAEERRRRDSIEACTTLAGFIREAWPVVLPGVDLQWNWHLDLICSHLERTVRPTCDADRDIVINIAPRHGKSNLVSVFFPAWVWTWRPTHQFLTSSHGSELATRDAVAARRLVESTWYQDRWAITLADDENRKTRYQNTAGGHRVCTSTGAGGIGEGGDTLIADDPNPVKRGGLSAVDLEASHTWWDVVMGERRNDKRSASRIVIQQRLHEDDLTGHLLRKGTYRHVCLPTVYDPAHPYRSEDDPRTEAGALLWPERNDEKVIEEARRDMGSWAFAGQHQQLPSPGDGGILKREWWKLIPRADFPKWAEMDDLVVALDLAFKAKELNDPTGIAIVGRKGASLYGHRVTGERLTFVQQLARVRGMRQDRAEISAILIEDAANAAALYDTLRDEVPGMILIKARSSKEARAQAWSPRLEAGNMYLPEGEDWVDAFIEQCAAFPNGTHDDMVDAWGHAVTYLSKRSSAIHIA